MTLLEAISLALHGDPYAMDGYEVDAYSGAYGCMVEVFHPNGEIAGTYTLGVERFA